MKRVLIAIAAVVAVGLVVFIALAWRPGIGAVDTADASAFDQTLVARGEQLSLAGNCETCHSVDSPGRYAGGYAVDTEFGTIYATNITPDVETGIGAWSEEAFHRAMRQGVRRDGAHLFPAFPYTHFTRLTDEDIGALYAYLMTLEPISNSVPEPTLPFPLNWRALQGGWKLLFFNAGAFEPEEDKGELWNRGAYLAEGIGHCSACHTPRNALGAEEGGDAAYSGAVVGEWYAPAIDESPDALAAWTEEELFEFLRTGSSPLHGVAAGSMSEVVHAGLQALPDEDITALAVYFADLADLPEGGEAGQAPNLLEDLQGEGMESAARRGGQLFGAFCVSCHFTPSDRPMAERPALGVNSAIVGPEPGMFVHVALNGVSEAEGNPNAEMPGFRQVLSDEDIADIAAYLRAAYANEPGEWRDMVDLAREVRQDTAGQ